MFIHSQTGFIASEWPHTASRQLQCRLSYIYLSCCTFLTDQKCPSPWFVCPYIMPACSVMETIFFSITRALVVLKSAQSHSNIGYITLAVVYGNIFFLNFFSFALLFCNTSVGLYHLANVACQSCWNYVGSGTMVYLEINELLIQNYSCKSGCCLAAGEFCIARSAQIKLQILFLFSFIDFCFFLRTMTLDCKAAPFILLSAAFRVFLVYIHDLFCIQVYTLVLS